MEELVDYYPYRKLSFADPIKRFKDYSISNKDKKILKKLAIKKAEITELPVHEEKIRMWKDLNSLKEVRPLVWINEIPWHEMNVNDELTLKTGTEFSKFLETRLRRTIYQWEHMRVDMVVEPTIPCYLVVNDTGFGISEQVKISKTDEISDIYSREFIPQIEKEEDIEKIKNPKVSFNKKATEDMFQSMLDIFDGILKVEKRGIPGFWFAPWDELVRWWEPEKVLADLILKPGLVHKTMERLTNAYLSGLNQYESLNLLSLNNCNYRIGSGGLSYTDEIPRSDYNSDKIKTSDLWGCAAAQIFSNVSPKMHEEFALQYELKWLKRFGLSYYGCCEPLDKKIEILRKIPNLRKISMSPWVNLELGASNIGKDYVFSYKPSPSIFIDNFWDPDSIKDNFIKNLKKIKNCTVEIIMKDISTVNYKPERLWEWAKIAIEVVERL